MSPGRLLVEAGAGCGKTYGLVARYLRGLGVDKETGKPLPGGPYLEPSQILAVTFTEDAAAEMKERVLTDLARDPSNASLRERVLTESQIGTFHGLCLRLLRPHLKTLGYDAESGLVPGPAAQHLRRRHILRELARDPAGRRLVEHLDPRTLADLGLRFWFEKASASSSAARAELEAARARFDTFVADLKPRARAAWGAFEATAKPEQREKSWLRRLVDALDGDETAAGAMRFNTAPLKHPLAPEAQLFAALAKNGWSESLRPAMLEAEAGLQAEVFDFLARAAACGPRILDFDALEAEVHALLESGVRLLSPPRLVLVDEFQDTNRTQYEIVRGLSDERTEWYFVGDPKQSIYSFRGADVGVFLRLKDELPLSPLDTNHRSEAAPLAFMNSVQEALFRGRPGGADPEPQSLKVAPKNEGRASLRPSVRVRELGAEESNVSWLLENFRAFRDELGPEATHAALFRTWKELFRVAFELRAEGVRVRLPGSETPLRHPLTELFASVLEWLDNPTASEGASALRRWVGSDWDGSAPSAAELARYRALLDRPGWTETLDAFASLLRPSRWENGALWLTCLRPVLEELSEAGWELHSTRAELGRFLRQRGPQFDTEAPYALAPEEESSAGAPLELMTIHGSKGLQWDVVYLPELYEKRRSALEAAAESDDDAAVRLRLRDDAGRPRRSLFFERGKRQREIVAEAEMRRLFYVAVTRAVKGLAIAYAAPPAAKALPPDPTALLGWPPREATPWNEILARLRSDGSLDALVADGSLAWTSGAEAAEGDAEEAPKPEKSSSWSLPKDKADDPPASAPFYREGVSRYLARGLDSTEAAAYVPPRRALSEEAQVRRQQAAHLGEEIHAYLEIWDGSPKGLEKLAPPPVIRAALEGVRALPELEGFWKAAAAGDPGVHRELALFVSGPDYRLSGFADAAWVKADEVVIIDWKTSRSLRSLAEKRRREIIRAQLEVYGRAFRPLGRPVRGLAVGIEVGETPRVRVVFDGPCS